MRRHRREAEPAHGIESGGQTLGFDAASAIASSHGWLSHTPLAFRRAVLTRCSLREYEAVATIFEVGDPPSGMFGQISGKLAISLAPRRRGLHNAHFATPGAWFGEAEVISGQRRRTGLVATERSQLLHLPLHAIKAIAQKDPRTWRFVGLVALGHLETAVGASADLMFRDYYRRLVAVLLRLGDCRFFDSATPVPVEIDVSQEDLANLANVARTTAGAVLRQLEKSGHVELSYRHVRLIAPNAMRALLSERSQAATSDGPG